jgi:hypothetical protein
VLGVSRSDFHAWLRRQPSKRWISDVRLLELIHAIHRQSQDTQGSPRITAELPARGIRVGRKRVERLMRRQSLSGLAKRRRAKTTVRGARRAAGARPGAPRLPADRAEPALGGRRDRGLDLREQAQLARGARLLQPAGGRLGNGGAQARRARRRGARDGGRRCKPKPGLVHHSDSETAGVWLGPGGLTRTAID